MAKVSKVIIVTGAASGIGRAFCLKMAAPGVGLLLHTRQKRAALDALAAQAAASGAATLCHAGDLAEPGLAGAIVAAARDRFGRLDVLVSNAGSALRQNVGAFTSDQFEAAWRSGPAAFVALAEASIPLLKQSDCARIIAVSSFVTQVFRAETGLFPVTAAVKAAIEALVRSLAVQLAGDGITVNAVAPGFTRKDSGAHSAMSDAQWQEIERLIPLGRRAAPVEIANVIAWLASADSSYVTGQILRADGGL